MDLSAKQSWRLPLLKAHHSSFISGKPNFGVAPFVHQNRRFRRVSQRRMVAIWQDVMRVYKLKWGLYAQHWKFMLKRPLKRLKLEKFLQCPQTLSMASLAMLGQPQFGSLEAVNKIYKIKGRKRTSPLAICVGDVADIGESSMLEKSLNQGMDSIGVRVPDCNFIRVIARGSGTALALTSANLSGHCSSVSTKDFEILWDHCAYVYDGGVLPSGRAGSTVVDLAQQGKFKILRPGNAREETAVILGNHSLVEEVNAT